MSTKPTEYYSFEGYTVRPMTEQDRPYLEMQIKADPYHRNSMTADHFLRLLPGESSWALEDADGCVVFYFKNSPAIRMTIQFAAPGDLTGKTKTMNGLIKGLQWIEAIFQSLRFREIFFDTQAPELHLFAKRRLGFADAPNLLSRPLPPFKPREEHLDPVGSLPTSISERVR